MLAIRGILAIIDDLEERAAARAAARRRKASDRKTLTIPQVRKTADYAAASPQQRSALDALDPYPELVHKEAFRAHAAILVIEAIDQERCAKWPYRNVDIDNATDDLLASSRSIQIGTATYYHHAPAAD